MRLLLAFAACKNLHIQRIDITAASLHAGGRLVIFKLSLVSLLDIVST